jgi:tRNA (mo5U34)-methyltransferase
MTPSHLQALYDWRPDYWGDEIERRLADLRQSRFEKFFQDPRDAELWPTLGESTRFAGVTWRVEEDTVALESQSGVFDSGEPGFTILQKYMPWKKGPFRFDSTLIDAEWRSDLKWRRLLPHIPDLKGKVIADIGASNGYFMFRMAEHQPEFILGVEPASKPWANFMFMQNQVRMPSMTMEPIDVDQLAIFDKAFDVIFFMGVIYHHKDPFGALATLFRCLKPGGTLILESQGIPGEEPCALVPRSRYAHARGVYYLPTASCIQHWLHRSNFRDIECFANIQLTPEQQRTTEWAPIRSLKDFLKPDDPSKTIEGYPAPLRIYFKARR